MSMNNRLIFFVLEKLSKNVPIIAFKNWNNHPVFPQGWEYFGS
jgi:hypothetical protein